MEIFNANLLYEINIEGIKETEFHQETYLISAASEKEAFRYATEKGQNEADTFVNSNGHLVYWKFLGLSGLEKLCFSNKMVHICDKTLQPLNPDKFLKTATEKASKLKQSYLYPAIN